MAGRARKKKQDASSNLAALGIGSKRVVVVPIDKLDITSMIYWYTEELLEKNTGKLVVLFSLGQVVATPGAIDLAYKEGVDIFDLIARHVSGDWGDLDEHDKKQNDYSVKNNLRILSSYKVGQNGDKIWIITEWDRSVTTALLPEDY